MIRSFYRTDHKPGFTLIELLTVLGMIGLLLAIILPAVQSIRSRSHRLQCSHQLRQITLALHNYIETHSLLPPCSDQEVSGGPFLGTFVRLFPQLEISTNAVTSLNDPAIRIGLLKCPADSNSEQAPDTTSYVLNTSPGENAGPRYATLFAPTGSNRVRLSDAVDGTSQTAAISEGVIVQSNGSEAAALRRPFLYSSWRIPYAPVSDETYYNPGTPAAIAERTGQTEQAIQDCQYGLRDFLSTSSTITARSWRRPESSDLYYTHWLSPNFPICSSFAPFGEDTFIGRNNSASSLHQNGVNVAMLDGRVVFVNEQIYQLAWRAMGTMAGQEAANIIEQ